jgi:hypothetical protein
LFLCSEALTHLQKALERQSSDKRPLQALRATESTRGLLRLGERERELLEGERDLDIYYIYKKIKKNNNYMLYF